MKMHSKLKLAAAPTALGIALMAQPVMAQDVEDDTVADAPEPIVVTGSRIQTTSFDTVAPVTVIGEQSIESTGAVNIQETLLRDPVMGTPSFSRTNTSFSTSGTGLSTVDLRNLGISRTLILVDGRRHVSGVPGSSAVDLNAIPTALIDRVDILTSGSGSAIYGSDAVAGVINFILKDDFEGFDVEGSAGVTEVGDSPEYTLGVTMGSNFADGRGNATLFAGYSYEGTAYLRDHKTEAGPSERDSLSALYFGGDYQDVVEPFYSSYSPYGTYFTDNYSFTYAPNGVLQGCTTTNGTTCTSGDGVYSGVGPTGFNRTFFRYLAAPTERFMLTANATYDIADNHEFFLQGSYINTAVESNVEPFPFASADAYSDGQIPIETMLDDGTIFRNPFVPDAIYNDASDTNGDGLRDIYVTKRLTSFGPRNASADRDTFRIVLGMRGDITDSWNYETFFNYGKTKQIQLGTGQINTPALRQALAIIPDPSDPTGTTFICADAAARDAGCQPANIFGRESLSPESLAYLEAPTSYNADVSQMQIGAFVGGDLFALYSDIDPIQVTTGVEYRKEESSSVWDVLSQRGLNAGNALPPTVGEFDVKEAYIEGKIPLMQDSFLYDVSIRGAARISDYSTVGQTFSWNAGGEIAVTPDLRFRAMYAETVRAPNINELFAGLSQTYPTLTDPCSGATDDGSVLGTACFADPGVRNNAAANGGVFTLNGTSDVQGVTGFDGGNPLLNEETGKTFTAGVVLNPTFIPALENLTLTVDYFNIEVADYIQPTSRQFILNQCYTEGNTALCDQFVTRREFAEGPYSAGSLDEVNTSSLNSGGLKTEGIDVKVNYNTGLGFINEDADLRISFAYTHLIEQYIDQLQDTDEEPLDLQDGEVGYAKDRFTSQVFLGLGDVTLAATGTYYGPSYLDDQLTGVTRFDEGYEDYRWHDEFYLDLQARWNVTDRHEFYVGVDNVTDNSPVYAGGLMVAGMETDTGTYDPLGRRYYAGFKISLD
ncbi:TonB-dependent receptor [Qipengyuania sp. 1NDH17]|uniref:TonB-dependent receptor n=1 Tax=Qipengyuania polymorpha TaxID=2867234 RepID=A0ABS7IWU1_9SPHN|nr:TonB-dependent receptor [Qipengyuania polymorpha]MBX7458015.1 TonB-dependent receptor [Qipengyuania polymorpha]